MATTTIYVPAMRGLVMSLGLASLHEFTMILWRAPSAAERKLGIQTAGMVAYVGGVPGVRPRLAPAIDGCSPSVWLGGACFDIPEKSRAALAAWLDNLPPRVQAGRQPGVAASLSGVH